MKQPSRDQRLLHPMHLRVSGRQFSELTQLADELGMPMQELIRRAIDAYIASERERLRWHDAATNNRKMRNGKVTQN